MRQILGVLFSAALLFGSMSSLVFAQATGERILNFESRVQVQPDSKLIVTETIQVQAEGNKIKRGIYRDFPTVYKNRQGHKREVGFNVVSVTRDGNPESYFVEKLGNGQRVYIGDRSCFLPSGRYQYVLTYRTDRQVGFFEDHDELYWNATGNGWDFSIDSSSAIIELPSAAAEGVRQMRGWVGARGSQDQSVTIRRDDQQRIIFTADKMLSPRHGLTVAVSWPKGIVRAPIGSIDQKFADERAFWEERNAICLALACFLVILAYYIMMWILFGKDPAKGTIIPLYHPPRNMSPAMVRFIYKMGYDHKAFAAAILGLAVRGYYRIKEGKWDGYYLIKTGKEVLAQSPEETVIKTMTLPTETFSLNNGSYETIHSASEQVEAALKGQEGNVFFVSNREFFWIGAAMTLGYLLLCPGIISKGDNAFFWCVVFGFGLAALNILFYYLLQAPTVMGRRTMDQIEGFKLYLSVAEKDQLKAMKSPEKTPELFVKFLPYALALDVEQQWAGQFADLFARLKQEGYGDPAYSDTGYYLWYFNDGRFDFGDRFTSQVSASLTPPGSSSAFSSDSGGGGSSGGGGGGGGGGGW